MKKPTINTLKIDLDNTKKADKKKIVFDVIKKWLLEINEHKEEFRTNFLSDKADKEFEKIKDKVGEFKDISKMNVVTFLAHIIVGFQYIEPPLMIRKKNGDEFFEELHKEFEKIKEDFYTGYNKSK